MKRTIFVYVAIMISVLSVLSTLYTTKYLARRNFNHSMVTVVVPAPQPEKFTKQFAAALDVARVFGRSAGCAEADPKLIDTVASEALKADMDPRLLAATVAVESACDPMAVSKRGAIGFTQIMPKIWKDKFDFANTVNLFNPNDNLHAGATILSGLIKQYGVAAGVRRYQGIGVDCTSCDDNYVPKILALAGRH